MSGEPCSNQAEEAQAPVVLVVEDEVLIRFAIAEYLRECGYTVIEAATGSEAKAVFEAHVAVNVVFSDIQMPGEMDGFALARWVRANHPEIPVVLTSGVARAADAAEDLCESGPLMAKPYEARDVENRIKLLLAARAAATGRDSHGR